MLRKLKLYGELAEFVGHKEFEIQVDSLAKAVSFLVNNFPQVEASALKPLEPVGPAAPSVVIQFRNCEDFRTKCPLEAFVSYHLSTHLPSCSNLIGFPYFNDLAV